jgi:hypothetical protein
MTVRETERKYEASDARVLPDPAELLGLASGRGAEEQSLEAVYFDTVDLRLARAGITLRRREGGSDPGWHLKLPAGGDSRDEVRMPVGPSRQHPQHRWWRRLGCILAEPHWCRSPSSPPNDGGGCSPTRTVTRSRSWSTIGSAHTQWANRPGRCPGGKSR